MKHFLLECDKHTIARKELRKKVGWRNMRIQTLLGDPKVVKDTMEFVERTERLKFKT